MEREKPKLEKKVQMCEDHIHALEQKLRESEKERQRYQNEFNRIKEMMQKMSSSRHAAQIGKYFHKVEHAIRNQASIERRIANVPFLLLAKPIRAGQSGNVNRPVAQAK